MKKGSLVLLVLSVMLVTFVRFNISSVQPTFTVTETSTEITVENDFFKAVFDVDPANKHGKIRWFYIKPDDTVNIVATSSWKFLGGHEAHSVWGTTLKTGTDWSAMEKESQTTQIIEQTSDYVVIESNTQWKSGSTYLNYQAVDYWTFFSDKPYYILSSTRTYNEQVQYNGNYEYCWLFNDTWAERYHRLDHDGNLVNTTGNVDERITEVWESRFLEKYPYTMMYSDTYSKGHFSILVSANPTSQGLGYLSTTVGYYKEYQLMYGDASYEIGESNYFTVVNGVASNITYVDDLSTSLWSTTAYISESQTHSVASNNQTTEKPELQSSAWSLWFQLITANQIQIGQYTHPATVQPRATVYVRFYPQYTNATGTYNIYASPSISQTWNKSYTNLTMQNDYQSKLRLTTELQLWNNSDPFKLKWTFETLASLNITSLTIHRKSGWNSISHETVITNLNASVIKMNCSGYSPEVVEEAFTFQNITNNVIEYYNGVGDSWIKWHGLNQTEAVVGSGNIYTVELLIQQHRRFSFESQGVFGLSDVLGVGEKANDRFEKLVWAKFPFFDTATPFRINHLGVENGTIYGAGRQTNQLSFKIVAPSGITTTKIYVGSEGEPIVVAGADWSYSDSILSLTVTHSSSQEVVVIWPSGLIPGDVNGDRTVDIFDIGEISAHWYPGPPIGPLGYDANADINDDGAVDILDIGIVSSHWGQTL